MPTVAIDFDGVIHRYSKGWQDGTIYDEPMPGAKEFLRYLLKDGWDVVIWSTRCHDRTVKGIYQPNQRNEMATWLATYDIPYTRLHCLPEKPLCKLFIDDNAYRFKSWVDDPAMIDLIDGLRHPDRAN